MIPSFQREINGSIRIATGVGAILIGENNAGVAFLGTGYELGKYLQCDFYVAELFA